MTMSRDEYRGEAEEFFDIEFIKRVPFPELLMRSAQELFMTEDMDSEFALETRRRLKQLNQLGWTD